MSVTLEIPAEIADALRAQLQKPLEHAALEAAAVEWYREGRLLHSQFAKLLGLSRYDADGVLKRHGIFHDISPEGFDEEVRAATGASRP